MMTTGVCPDDSRQAYTRRRLTTPQTVSEIIVSIEELRRLLAPGTEYRARWTTHTEYTDRIVLRRSCISNCLVSSTRKATAQRLASVPLPVKSTGTRAETMLYLSRKARAMSDERPVCECGRMLPYPSCGVEFCPTCCQTVEDLWRWQAKRGDKDAAETVKRIDAYLNRKA
jgi:hypothetical protein